MAMNEQGPYGLIKERVIFNRGISRKEGDGWTAADMLRRARVLSGLDRQFERRLALTRASHPKGRQLVLI